MDKEERNELIKILVCIAMLVVIMAAEHSGILPGSIAESRYMMIPYLVPYLICGAGVIKGAISGVLKLEFLDEKFLMTIASIGAFIIGEYSEGTAVILLYQLGEWFQDYALGRSRESIKELMDIAPDQADVIGEDGKIRTVQPKEVGIGDLLLIKPGEKIPVDGHVVEGSGMIDTSAITGESMPAMVSEGDKVYSGSINGDKALRMEAEKAFQDSTVSRILELVENASEKKSKTENFITRFARIYTPIVVSAAALLVIIPSLLGIGEVTDWLYRACSFLVISCPCAIVLSVPLSFFGGIGAASRIGVLVKGSNYLELLSQVDELVTDKTGTITKGSFKVSEVKLCEGATEEEVLRIAAHAENYSSHPIAESIKAAYEGEIDLDSVSDVEAIGGKGVRAKIESDDVLVGSGSLLEESGIDVIDLEEEGSDKALSAVFVSRNGELLGEIIIEDEIKDNAKETLSKIKELGVKSIVMLTGDRKETAEAVAKELEIDRVYHELLPQDKVSKVEEILGEDKVTCFVGDGVNDAPVLMRSDVGIAMGSMGSDAAIEAADVVIMDDDISKIPEVIRIAKRTLSIAKANIAFALFVKLLILVLSMFGITNMWFAVFADVGVSFLCIMNSLRMLRVNRSK